MSKEHENRYKMCRNNAGLTQEQAAELLHVAPRTLSDYENGKTPPDDIVAAMAEIYKSPLLAWWHLKHHSILGKFLPEITPPQTHGDMAFQLICAHEDLESAVMTVRQIVKNKKICEETGQMCDNTKHDFKRAVDGLRQVKAKILSSIIFADKISDD